MASTLAWEAQVSDFWSGLRGTGFSPQLIERVWVANTCIGMTASNIARRPLRFYGSGREPAWVANPDPVWYPNGIGDALYAAIDSCLRWGDAYLYVTSRYADGYPSGWTVVDAATMTVGARRGRRVYRAKEQELDPADVVQISRDPKAGSLTGTSVVKSYASQAYGLLAASDLGRVMMQSDVPQYALKPKRKATPEQAEKLQTDWMGRVARRSGAPWVLPPDLEVEKLSFSVADMMLLDAQKFNAQILATSCGVPALFLNLGIEGGLNYQTPGLLGEYWWRFFLLPIASSFASALGSQMLPAGSYVEFDARQLLQPTFSELADTVTKLIEAGVIVAQEGRAILGLPVEEATDALMDLLTPPSAGASPAQQQSAAVVALRPTVAAN